MAPNFRNLLNKPIGDAKRPDPLPQGTYFGTIQRFQLGESRQNKTPYVEFQGKYSHPGDDVEDLGEVDISKRNWRFTFYITDDALWRLNSFLKSLGFDTDAETPEKLIADAVGQTVQLSVVQAPTQETDDNGEPIMVNNVRNMSGTEG